MGDSVAAMDLLFNPESVAIVGASPDSWYSSQLIDNLLDYGYEGSLYLVNPGREEAWDRPCYDSINDIPETVDLAVVSVPRDVAVDVVHDAGKRGVPAALVITAGFSETGEIGKEYEDKLAAATEKYGIRICGPNCIGLADTHAGTVLTSTCSRKPKAGSIGLISQSGALAFTTFYERAADEDVHFSKIISTGNEADLTLTDFVEYMAKDSTIDVICAYIEGLDDPRRFVEVADNATRDGTPVLTMKIGQSEAAKAASLSHTGSLTGNDDAWNAACKQAGVERVSDIYDLLSRSRAHAAFEPPASNNICVASTSGGMASLLADLSVNRGLVLPQLRDETATILLEMEELLTFDSVHNPIDIRGYGADVLPEIANAVFRDGTFDAYVFAIGLSAVDERAEDIANGLLSVVNDAPAPVFILWTGRKKPHDFDNPQPYERVREVVPLYYDPSRCMDAVESLVDFRSNCKRVQSRVPWSADIGGRESVPGLPPDQVLGWTDASNLLSDYGIEIVSTRLATSAPEAVDAAETLGFPIVLKVDSPDIPHRLHANAVEVGLETERDVETAYRQIIRNVSDYDRNASINGVLVQPYIEEGTEAMMGVSRDDGFGPLITVATGGSLVEILDDSATCIPPVPSLEARRAIEATKLPELLAERFGDQDKVDELADMVTRLGKLAVDCDSVAEIDLNPVVVTQDQTVAVDVLLRTN